eukprot:scaffold82273_cov32-Phaeocystis_antarctica.AAC.3
MATHHNGERVSPSAPLVVSSTLTSTRHLEVNLKQPLRTWCVVSCRVPYISTAAPLGHTPYLTGGQRVRGAAPEDFFTFNGIFQAKS